MHNRGNIATSTRYESSYTSEAAPSIGRVRITQTSSSERSTAPQFQDGGGQFWHQPGATPQSSGAKNQSYYDRRYSVSATGGYISSGQMNGDFSKSTQQRTPLKQQNHEYHRRYSFTSDKTYNRENSVVNNVGQDLDFEAEEYLSKEIRPYSSSVRKIKTRNHLSAGSGNSSGGDLGGNAPYLSPYRRVQSPTSPPRVLPLGDPIGGRASPQAFIRRRTPSSRAGSMSRIETLETLRENQSASDAMDRRMRMGRRSMSVTRGGTGVGARRAQADLVDVELGAQPMDVGYEDDSYELRRQLRVARNRTRASSASRMDPRERAGSVPAGEVRIIYPPRYSVSSITSSGRRSPSFINQGSADIHIVQSMGTTTVRGPGRRRAASVSRVSYTGGVPRVVETPLIGAATPQYHRSSSITGMRYGGFDSGSSGRPYTGSSGTSYVRMSSSSDADSSSTYVRGPTLYGMRYREVDEDLTRYVLEPGEEFLPTDVSVSTLPSGKKAVTYTRFKQTGTGDQRQANIEIERIVQKTKKLQESLNTLEDFVRRNRSLFPEDIIIYQKIIFYLLGADELRAHGYPPDAEVYGVKIREKLVAPYGTDVASILRRHYKRYTEVDVIYEEREAIRRRLRAAELETQEEQIEEERRRKRRLRVDTEIIEEEEEWLRRRREAARRRQNELYVDEEEFYKRPRASPRQQREEGEPPQFSAMPKGRTVGTGDTVKFSCAVLGYPEPTIEWFHNNKPLFNTSRHTIDDRYIGSSSVCIRNVQREDAGAYTARAVNMHGEVSASAQLYIDEDELTRRKEALRRPWFIHEVHNTTTQVGQMVVLEAQATGKPLPTFRWQRNNIDLVDDIDHIKIVSDGAGGTKLIIRDVRTSDAGLYVCVAENSAGRTACSATLRVGESFDLTEYYSGLPKFGDLPDLPGYTQSTIPSATHKSRLPQLPFELDEIIMKNWKNPAGFYLDFDGEEPAEGRKPRFVKVPSSQITVQEGDPLTLRCTVEGYPKPLVKWYKGVRELTYTGRHRVLAEGNDSHMMQIRMTMLTDPGEYTIVALNSCGMVKYTIYVNVVPRSPEEIETTRKRPEHALQEYDLIKKTAQGKMAPVFIKKLPREKEIIVGGTLKIECHVDEAKMREYVVGYDIVVKDADKGVSHRPDYDPTSYHETRPLSSSSSSSATIQPSSTTVQPSPVSPVVHRPEGNLAPGSGGEQGGAVSVQAVPLQNGVQEVVHLEPTTSHQSTAAATQELSVQAHSENATEALSGSFESEISDASSGKKSKAKKSTKSDKGDSSAPTVEVTTENADAGKPTEVLQDLEAVLDASNVVASEAVSTSTPAQERPVESIGLASGDAGKEALSAEVSFASSDEEEMTAEAAGAAAIQLESSAAAQLESSTAAQLESSTAAQLESSTAAQHESLPSAAGAESTKLADLEEGHGSEQAPRMLTMLESCVAPTGSTASFTCSISGHPPINVQWLREGRPLESGENLSIHNNISEDGSGSCRLDISRVSTVDEGQYTVTISNGLGQCSCTASLSVIDKVVPQISVTFDDDEQDDDDDDDVLSELSADND